MYEQAEKETCMSYRLFFSPLFIKPGRESLGSVGKHGPFQRAVCS